MVQKYHVFTDMLYIASYKFIYNINAKYAKLVHWNKNLYKHHTLHPQNMTHPQNSQQFVT